MGEINKREVLAFIPARGGSKGLPRKNVLPLGGRPLVTYGVEAAKAVETIDRIIVSTDDEEIAEAAIEAGAEVPFLRPDHLGGDHVHLQEVLFHLIDTLTENEAYFPDIYVTILPTFPFIGSETIDAVVSKCIHGSFSAFNVAPWRLDLNTLFVQERDNLVPLMESEGGLMPEVDPEGIFLGQSAVSAVHTLPKGCRPQDDRKTFVDYVNQLTARGVIDTSQQCYVVEDPIALIDVDVAEDLALARAILARGFWKPVTQMEASETDHGD